MLNPDAARAQRAKAILARTQKKARAASLQKKCAAAKKAAKAGVPVPDDAAAEEEVENQPNLNGKRRRKAATGEEEDDDEEDDETPSCLHPDDPGNFLKLSEALRILLGRKINDVQIDQAEGLLRGYCQELILLYGPDVMKPNHHYATHIPEFVRDYGPLHGFCTFLFERLNKVLKSYKTNNHSGGELETTFFREFHRTVLTSRMVARAARPGQPQMFQDSKKRSLLCLMPAQMIGVQYKHWQGI